jgi:hypothetical protein
MDIARLPAAERLTAQFSAQRAEIRVLEQKLSRSSLPQAKHKELIELKSLIEEIIQDNILATHGAYRWSRVIN